MTPLEQIKRGILEKDFGMVADGYHLMTGEVVPVESFDQSPVKKRAVKKKAVKRKAVKKKTAKKKATKKSPAVKKRATKKRAVKKATAKKSFSLDTAPDYDGLPEWRGNNFVDDFSQATNDLKVNLSEEDRRKMNQIKRAELSEYYDVEVTCERCNKTHSVHPELVKTRFLSQNRTEKYYICDRCQ